MFQQVRAAPREERPRVSLGKILLVDEDTQDLNYHATLFEAKGFAVSKCQLYETGIRSIEREKFGLVVVDYGSAAFEGRIVLRYVKQWQPSTPCVVLTRNRTTDSYLRALELGAAECLRKPLSILDMDLILHNDVGIMASHVRAKLD